MNKSELDGIVDASAERFVGQMGLKGRLGSALESGGHDASELSQEQIHSILVRTIIKLYDEYAVDIENERDQEDEDHFVADEEALESEEIEEEEREEVDTELRKDYFENEESDKSR
jgi:hypothetical protein